MESKELSIKASIFFNIFVKRQGGSKGLDHYNQTQFSGIWSLHLQPALPPSIHYRESSFPSQIYHMQQYKKPASFWIKKSAPRSRKETIKVPSIFNLNHPLAGFL